MMVGGVVVAGPQQPANVDDMFQKVKEQFKLDDAVIKYFKDDIGIESLEDFSRLFSSEAEVGPVVEKVPGSPDVKRLLQAARVRQAWIGVRDAMVTATTRNKKCEEDPDLDNPLPQHELDELENAFWKRHHLYFEADEAPADTLVSRCSRELTRRLLTVRDVWKVKVVAQEQSGGKKRTELAKDIAIVLDTDPPIGKPEVSVRKYLDLLWTLLLGYAKAGVLPRADAPKDGEPRGSTSTMYVSVPLDVCMRYHKRAQSFAMQLPPADALDILVSRDEAERRAWVDRFRSSTLTLGEVMADVYDKRQGIWATLPLAADKGSSSSRRRRSPSPRKAQGHKITPGGYCVEFNTSRCSEPCPYGAKHRCNAPLKTGRPCNLPNHNAARCRNKFKVPGKGM